jgi:hypothetical protein
MDIFKPKAPAMPEPAKAPTIDEAARSQDMADAKRRRKGRQSTILVADPVTPKQSVLGG